MSARNWDSADTEVLFNPRMPDDERRALLAIQAAMPTLPGHFWLTTSGSSGLKWVALSKQALLTSAEAVNRHLESDAADSWAQALPEFHVGGLGILARGFLSGARVHPFANAEGNARWSAAAFYAFLTETGTTLTALVPAQLHDLVQGGLVSPPALRAVVIGGGALDPALYTEARRLGWPVLASYGLSECCSQVATASLHSLKEATAPEGLPLLPHVTARIDEDGRILLQSHSLLTGYGLPAEHPGGTPRFVDSKQDGWFRTEDRGQVTNNRLTLLGRVGDFIKIGGESVEMPRLERILAQVCHAELGCPETVLIAAPDSRLGAVIHLVAVGGPSPLQQESIARIAEHFARLVLPFERIRQVHWVDSLPRSPLGKLLRKTLLMRLGLHNA